MDCIDGSIHCNLDADTSSATCGSSFGTSMPCWQSCSADMAFQFVDVKANICAMLVKIHNPTGFEGVNISVLIMAAFGCSQYRLPSPAGPCAYWWPSCMVVRQGLSPYG